MTEVFAGLPVRDFAASLPWYERLLGEPSFRPHETEAVWTLADGGHVYIVERPEDAGHGLATLLGFDTGLEPDAVETYDNGVRKAIFRDPDGNEIGIAEPPG